MKKLSNLRERVWRDTKLVIGAPFPVGKTIGEELRAELETAIWAWILVVVWYPIGLMVKHHEDVV